MKKIFFISLLIFSKLGVAKNIETEWNKSSDVSNYPDIAEALVSQGLYFTAVPLLKEYLTTAKTINSKKLDDVIEDVAKNVGLKQFEILPNSILARSTAPTIKYILAKKFFRANKFRDTVAMLDSIPEENSIYPFSLMLKASALSVQGEYVTSSNIYKQCVKSSEKQLKGVQGNELRQLSINRDYCILGTARNDYAQKKYVEAYSSFLDLDKEAYVWPETLAEEAWNSFYMKDYNRSLGKLVTYKAPFFDYVLNPETDVLNAMSYYEMCLYEDVKKTVDDFYNKYEKDLKAILDILSSHTNKYAAFYELVENAKNNKSSSNASLNIMIKSIIRDPIFIELNSAFELGKKEIQVVSKFQNKNLSNFLSANLREGLTTQRDILGSYTQSRIKEFTQNIKRSFVYMSNIKLEVLEKQKKKIYSDENYGENGKRGDLRYLKRNEKQYFWSFNGEFWADELGDYVFALRSECE